MYGVLVPPPDAGEPFQEVVGGGGWNAHLLQGDSRTIIHVDHLLSQKIHCLHFISQGSQKTVFKGRLKVLELERPFCISHGAHYLQRTLYLRVNL